MKRIISFVLSVCICAALFAGSMTAYAAESGLELTYELRVDGGETTTVKPGSIVTVSFAIDRADGSDEQLSLRILQNEIIYDQDFFEFVDDSIKVERGGGSALFQTRTDGTHIIKASYLSSGGGTFKPGDTFCTFQLRVVGTEGSGWVSCDWECAKAYDGDNEAASVEDADNDVVSDVRVTAEGPCHVFVDVKESDWFHEAVDYVSLRGLMNGVEDDQFAPNGTMTRAMLVTVLYRLDGSPEISGKNIFKDVKDGQWYTDAVIWAKENGVVDGVSDTEFAPDSNITREQIATVMCRYAKIKGADVNKTVSLAGYTDAGKISSWADSAMRWANSVGLITGRTDTTLVPQGTATRAEVATILMRFCENILR